MSIQYFECTSTLRKLDTRRKYYYIKYLMYTFHSNGSVIMKVVRVNVFENFFPIFNRTCFKNYQSHVWSIRCSFSRRHCTQIASSCVPINYRRILKENILIYLRKMISNYSLDFITIDSSNYRCRFKDWFTEMIHLRSKRCSIGC